MSQELRDRLQTTLGSAFTLERELSGGGMSRVFVAEDHALGRKIVVKILPSETAAGVSVERFKREIQVIARLQHPHIVPILSAGELRLDSGAELPFYTMPFVKGESLRGRLARGGELSVTEAVHVLRDVAAALAYAHGEGVVHRDIKPDNVIVSGGVAVVTDFGVSKAVDVAATEGDHQPTGITSLGVALGTPAYMAPEQASADPHVDHRADIYSFGCLAYELLAGASPFAGRPPQQILAAHVTEMPESLLKRRPNTPPALAALIMRCLEKRAGDRPQSAEELLTALDAIATTPSGGMTPTAERLAAVTSGNGAKWIAAAAVLVAVVALAALGWSRLTSIKPIAIGTTSPVAVSPELEGEPAISPDGKVVAYTSSTPDGRRIFVRQLGGGRAVLLAGDIRDDQGGPAWTPDGTRVSFVAGGTLFVTPALTGGSARPLIAGVAQFRHAWARDGDHIAFARLGAMAVRSVSTGEEHEAARGGTLHSPSWSPDGRWIAYVKGTPATMANISPSSVWVVRSSGGHPTLISDSASVNLSPVWSADGKSVLYVSNRGNTRDVYQQPLGRNGSPVGAPMRVTTALGSYTISLSQDGTSMAYDVVRNNTNIWWTPLASPSFASAHQVTTENQHVESMAVSHDRQWLAFDSDRSGNSDIYKMQLNGGTPIQLTTNPGNDFTPTWSPDDEEIAFHSQRGSSRDIYVVSASGTDEQQVTRGPEEDWRPSWSPDGRRIAFTRDPPGVVYVVERTASGWSAPRQASPDSGVNIFARISADGSIGYIKDSTIKLISPAGRIAVITDGRALNGVPISLTWGPDPATLFVLVRDGAGVISMWRVPVGGGQPARLLAEDATHRFARKDIATDDKRLFFILPQWEADVWVMELKR